VIPSRAVTVLALVINEMISNAIKHGMAKQSEGTIIVRGREEEGMVIVQVLDTGRGPAFKISFDESAEVNSEGLGLSLIRNLIVDLEGRFSLRRELLHQPNKENEPPIEYTVAEVRFPLVRRNRI
jgi:two-component sensor histidine kinase